MQCLTGGNGPSTLDSQPTYAGWNSAPDLTSIRLAEMLDLQANASNPLMQRAARQEPNVPHTLAHATSLATSTVDNALVTTNAMTTTTGQHHHHVASSLNPLAASESQAISQATAAAVSRKRRYPGATDVEATSTLGADVNEDVDEDDDIDRQEDHTNDYTTSSASRSMSELNATTTSTATGCHSELPPPPPKMPALSMNLPPEIDSNAVCQMGGLSYADLCKERAREAFKEAKKQEHLNNGNFDRMKRRKKNDTSMTPRQKYIRRLRMNQDSAAAARHAQEVYVQVLEKLVKTSEEEKKSFMAEMQVVRVRNEQLHRKVQELQTKVTELEDDREHNPSPVSTSEDEAAGLLDMDDQKRQDPSIAKILDWLKGPTFLGTQADMGVQPARAV